MTMMTSAVRVEVVCLLLAAAVVTAQQYDADRDESARSSGASDTLAVTAEVWSGAIAQPAGDSTPLTTAQRTVTIDVFVNSSIRFDLEVCARLPNPVIFRSEDSDSDFIRRRMLLVPFDAIECVNTTRLVINIQPDPFFLVRPGGEVIELDFLAAVFRDGQTRGYPYDPSAYKFWFRILPSELRIRTGINDEVLAVAYAVSTVSTLFAALVTNHPLLATVMPRCDFLFKISQCSFDTMYDVDPVQYPLQVSFGDPNDDVWAQFKAVGTMNLVFVVGLLLVVFCAQLGLRVVEELRGVDAAVERRRERALAIKEARRKAAEKRAHEVAVAATRLTEDSLRQLDSELREKELATIANEIYERRRQRAKQRRRERAKKAAPVQQKSAPGGAVADVPEGKEQARALSRMRDARRKKVANRRQRAPGDKAYSDDEIASDEGSEESFTRLLLLPESGGAQQDPRQTAPFARHVADAELRSDDGIDTDASSRSGDGISRTRKKKPAPADDGAATRRPHRKTATSLRVSKLQLQEFEGDQGRGQKKSAKWTKTSAHQGKKKGGRRTNASSSATRVAELDKQLRVAITGPPWFRRLHVALRRVWRHGVTRPGTRFLGSTVILTLMFLLFKSSMSSSAVVFWNVRDTGTRVWMVGVLLVWFLAPLAVTSWLVFYAYPRRCDVIWYDESTKMASNYDAFTGGKGYWDVVPAPSYRRRNAQRISFLLPLFEKFRPGRQWFVFLELVWSSMFGLLEATRSDRGCVIIAGPAFLLGLSNLILLLVLRPHATPFDRLFFTGLAVVYTVAPMAQTVFFLNPVLTIANVFAALLIVAALFVTFSRFVVASIQLHDFLQFRLVHMVPWFIYARIRSWWLGRGFYDSLAAAESSAKEDALRAEDAAWETKHGKASKPDNGDADADESTKINGGGAGDSSPGKRDVTVLRDDGIVGLAPASPPTTAAALGRQDVAASPSNPLVGGVASPATAPSSAPAPTMAGSNDGNTPSTKQDVAAAGGTDAGSPIGVRPPLSPRSMAEL